MRNIDINKVFFDVNEEDVYLRGLKQPLPGKKAITAVIDGKKQVFGVVTNNYFLLKNKVAYELVLGMFKKHFNNGDFSVFNVITPKTRSFVHIDVIHSAYSLNIWNSEIFLPFFRITNSYNRMKKFSVDMGFVRKLCTNGVIFERDIISISFTHDRGKLSEGNIELALSEPKFLSYQKAFEHKIKTLKDIKIDQQYFLPLATKILGLDFSLHSGMDRKKFIFRSMRKNQFQKDICALIPKYVKDGASSAYDLYNVITDYVSNVSPDVDWIRFNNINANQTKAGLWLSKFPEESKQPDFNIHNYAGEYVKEFSLSA